MSGACATAGADAVELESIGRSEWSGLTDEDGPEIWKMSVEEEMG